MYLSVVAQCTRLINSLSKWQKKKRGGKRQSLYAMQQLSPQHLSLSMWESVLKLQVYAALATSVCGLMLLVLAAFPTSVWGFKLLVYAALSYQCMRPYATSACGLTLLVYAALSY